MNKTDILIKFEYSVVMGNSQVVSRNSQVVSRNAEHFNLKNLEIDSLVLNCNYPGSNTVKVVQQVSSNAGCNVSLSCNYPEQNIFNFENVTVNNFVVRCNHPDRNVFNLQNSTFINRSL